VKIDRELVARVARLAALRLAPEEEAELSGQLTRIVEHFEALREVPDALLPPADDAPPAPLRTDEAAGTPPGPFVEVNAPETAHGHFVVPRVVSRD
jgi:aspartyl-tRNA(Asn)/glutamyl-tRNA(Gln) amidotransferase subunit C